MFGYSPTLVMSECMKILSQSVAAKHTPKGYPNSPHPCLCHLLFFIIWFISNSPTKELLFITFFCTGNFKIEDDANSLVKCCKRHQIKKWERRERKRQRESLREHREREREREHRKRESTEKEREKDRLIDEKKKEPEEDSQLCLFPSVVVLWSFFMWVISVSLTVPLRMYTSIKMKRKICSEPND